MHLRFHALLKRLLLYSDSKVIGLISVLFITLSVTTQSSEAQNGDTQIEKGKTLIRELGCVACHEIRGHETTVREEAPHLTFQGEIVQPGWLFDFLKRPHSIRPAIKARMPDFRLSDREVFAITQYLGTLLDGQPPVAQEYRYPRKILPGETEAAKKLISKDYFNCFNCHVLGDTKPAGKPEEWAPDLAKVRSRIKPDFLFKWLQNPPKYRPGTKMPAIFPDKDSGPDDILGGDELKQSAVVRDYVVSLGKPEKLSAYADAAAGYKEVTPAEGRALVKSLNCTGCHEMAVLPEGRLVGPNLSFEGSRVQKEWLANFLRAPFTIKPEYGLLGNPTRMPTFQFSEEELNAVVEYITQILVDRQADQEGPIDFALAKKGQKLFREKTCDNCHRIGSKAGGIGPDLTDAGKRLRPGWTINFIQRPEHYLNTRMPNLKISPEEARALAAYVLGPKN
ncbi:MAG: cytochrome c [Deltaproteobacteria bacterium]|nr:cytochrome c [Deltaproteobacteria bacterium]